MPLVNIGADPGMEYLSDGITESLISNFSRSPNLKVMSRNAVFRYKGKEIDPRAVGQDLKVEAVLTGQVVQRGDDLRLSLELVDTRDSHQLWGAQYNRKLGDILTLQEDISRQIYKQLRIELSIAEQEELTKHYTENNEAYQLYLKGRYFWNKFTEEGITELNKTQPESADWPPVMAGLAYAYAVSGERAEAEKILDELSELAIQRHVDPYLFAIVHTGLGNKNQAFEWLGKAYEERSKEIPLLKVEPKLDDLRSDPRFSTLLKKVGWKME